MQLCCAAKSDVGCVRQRNEDAYCIDEGLHLFVVADGMGGHQGGQTASHLAVETLKAVMSDRQEEWRAGLGHQPLEDAPVPRMMADGVRAACAAVFEAANEDPDLQGMGTTVTALLCGEGRAFVAHVGDSRCYLQRGERIIQVTDDHSLVNEQVKAGLMSWEESRQSRLRNVITRSVGFERDVAVDTFALRIEAGDIFLLCSDGLSNLVDDAEIDLQMRQQGPADVVRRLVAMARERGGDDNITSICVRVDAL